MKNFDFEKHFEETQHVVNSGFKVVAILCVAGALVSLTMLGLVTWVAIHFLTKVW